MEMERTLFSHSNPIIQTPPKPYPENHVAIHVTVMLNDFAKIN
jgi:hypothetical protein